MAATLLNVDNLKIKRTVVLGGRERVLNSMTVEQFIAADEFNVKFNEARPGGRVSLLVDHLLGYLEATTREELIKLDLNQLMMIMHFVRGDEQPVDEGKAEEATESTK